MWLDIVLLIIGLVLLILGGDFLVRGASNLAYSFQITPLVVGLTVVAFGTSAPELLVSLQAAYDGSADMSIGNVIGSNICNLSLVMGVTAIFYPIYVSANSIKIDWLVTIGSSMLFFFFASNDHKLSRPEGILFVVLLIIYTYFLIEMSRRQTKERMLEGEEEIPVIKGSVLAKEIGVLLIGVVGLYFGSKWFVGGARVIALYFGVEERIIALTVVALGTSLPELVTSSIAAYKKNTDLALGNLLGSCIFNVLSIIGITSIVKELEVGEKAIGRDMYWMIGIMLLLLPMMITRRRVARIEGVILLIVYVAFMYFVILPDFQQG